MSGLYGNDAHDRARAGFGGVSVEPGGYLANLIRVPIDYLLEIYDADDSLLLDPLIRLLDETQGQSLEVTVDDPQTSTEVPTEIWSSVEIMVFGPWSAVGPSEEPDDSFPDDPEFAIGGWPLVFHVHQRALCRNWHQSTMGPGDQNVIGAPASPAARAVLDGAMALTGVETPHANGPESPLYLALQKCGGFWNQTAEFPGWGFYAMPIYLKEPHSRG